MIDRFRAGFTALHERPGDFDPHARYARFTAQIDAELRMTGLGSAGGGSATQARDDGDDTGNGGGEPDDWFVPYPIIDADMNASDIAAARTSLRDHLPDLGCRPGPLIEHRRDGGSCCDWIDRDSWSPDTDEADPAR